MLVVLAVLWLVLGLLSLVVVVGEDGEVVCHVWMIVPVGVFVVVVIVVAVAVVVE